MTGNQWAAMIVSALTDFIISAGGSYMTAATASGSTAPSASVISFAIVTGLVAAARGVQKNLSPAITETK